MSRQSDVNQHACSVVMVGGLVLVLGVRVSLRLSVRGCRFVWGRGCALSSGCEGERREAGRCAIGSLQQESREPRDAHVGGVGVPGLLFAFTVRPLHLYPPIPTIIFAPTHTHLSTYPYARFKLTCKAKGRGNPRLSLDWCQFLVKISEGVKFQSGWEADWFDETDYMDHFVNKRKMSRPDALAQWKNTISVNGPNVKVGENEIKKVMVRSP